MTDIMIGASRATLAKMAQDLLSATLKENVEITFYTQSNTRDGDEIVLQFSNDDMEGRDDLKNDAVVVDIEE